MLYIARLARREPRKGKGLTGPICSSIFLNPFTPRLTPVASGR